MSEVDEQVAHGEFTQSPETAEQAPEETEAQAEFTQSSEEAEQVPDETEAQAEFTQSSESTEGTEKAEQETHAEFTQSSETAEQEAHAEFTQSSETAEHTKDEHEAAEPPDGDGSQRPRWYIVHTYSGFEQRVQKTINEMMRNGQDEGLIAEVIVPTERVVEVNRIGQKRTITRKSYPGYVLVRMIMTDLSWHLIQSIPKVTGFIGGKNRPAPMRDSEAQHILDLMKLSQDVPRPNFTFQRGEEVRVNDGPFMGFNAVVQDADYEKGKLTVTVTIFGRQTPTELDFCQVSK